MPEPTIVRIGAEWSAWKEILDAVWRAGRDDIESRLANALLWEAAANPPPPAVRERLRDAERRAGVRFAHACRSAHMRDTSREETFGADPDPADRPAGHIIRVPLPQGCDVRACPYHAWIGRAERAPVRVADHAYVHVEAPQAHYLAGTVERVRCLNCGWDREANSIPAHESPDVLGADFAARCLSDRLRPEDVGPPAPATPAPAEHCDHRSRCGELLDSRERLATHEAVCRDCAALLAFPPPDPAL